MLEFRYQYRPKAPPDQRWLPLSRAWQDSASHWLVLHDVFHHLPEDTGTLAEELASLGAEYYILHEGTGLSPEFCRTSEEVAPPGLNALITGACGIVGMAKEDCTHGPSQFNLAPIETASVPDESNAIFMAAETSAVSQLAEMLEGDPDPEWKAAYASFSKQGLISSWVRSGFLNAKTRFPDRERIQAAWKKAEEGIRDQAGKMAEYETLSISVPEYDAIFKIEPKQSFTAT